MWLQRSLWRPAGRCGARPRSLRVRSFTTGGGTQQQAAEPSASELLRDSRLAALSGLCYLPAEELEARLAPHGLHVHTHGNTHFTRWFVARHTPSAAAGAAAASAAAAAAAAAGSAGAPGPAAWLDPDPQQPSTYVFLRGVSWRSADLDALRVWQSLARALPSPFLPHLTSPPDLLVAHSGVAEMAAELFDVLRPHVEGHPRLHLAGHSLGGSLAILVALTAHLKLGGGSSSSSSANGSSPSSVPQAEPQQQAAGLQVRCTTFGSPPVLSLAAQSDEDGGSILKALQLPPESVKNYVLQDDPVPRALLSADPAFLALKQNPAVAGLLRLREQWLGPQGALSPTRFLYHPAGHVYLVRWSAEGGHSVRLLAPHTLQKELALDVETLRSSPLALMQAVMDHHHGSYSSELQAAAAAARRREGAAAAASAAAGDARSSASPAAAEFPGST